jgi:uncharacterized protein (TIGR02996 family)
VHEVERALLDAIVANPDDDGPRLVYADYLQTRGDPRGEFIQLQCQAARLDTEEPAQAELAGRAEELSREHGKRWLAELIELRLPNARFSFHRGFVEGMRGRFPAATLRPAELVARAPLLSALELSVEGQTDRIALAKAEHPDALARARALWVRGRHRTGTRDFRGPIADLAGLAAVPFTHLRELQLSWLRTRSSQLAALLATPALRSLEHLTLHLGMPGAELCEVVASLRLPNVLSLDLAFNAIGEDGIDALLQSSVLATVTELVLDGGGLGEAALDRLVTARMPKLRRLSLAFNAFGDNARCIAAWHGAPQLERLDLRRAGVSEDTRQFLLAERPGLVDVQIAG